MALPSKVKTWLHTVNGSTAATGTASVTARNVMYALKVALVGFAGGWVVMDSSAGAGAAPAGTDTWLAATNLIGAAAASNHSWIRLRQTGIATNFELCIDMNSTNLYNATIVVSPAAGFVNVANPEKNRPTATDEIVLITTSTWGACASTSDATQVLHVMQSSDGQCTRVVTMAANVVNGLWILDKPANPVTGWTNPSVSYAVGAATEVGTSTIAQLLAVAGNARGKGASAMNLFFTCEGTAAAALGSTLVSVNDLDSSYPFLGVGVGSPTAANRGRHGSMFDMYMGLASPGTSGDTFPLAGTNLWALFGDLILPWNGTAVTTA